MDLSDPVQAAWALGAIVAMLAFVIAMDARKLPLGRVKMVPWTGLTILLVMAALGMARLLAQDIVQG